MGDKFILQTHIASHENLLVCRKIVQEKICLSRLQQCRNCGPSPIKKNFSRIHKRHCYRESSQRIHWRIYLFILICQNVDITYIKLSTLFIQFCRHVFQPTGESHKVPLTVAVILYALTHILMRIIR